MSEARELYRTCVQRARRAVLASDPGVVAAIDALYRALGSELGKTKAEIARDVGLTTQRYFRLVYGLDDPSRPDGDDARRRAPELPR